MRHQLQRGLLALLAAGLAAVTLVAVAPAYGAAPSSSRATITVDRATCTVTATFTWKNVSGVSEAWVGIYGTSSYVSGPFTVWTTNASDSISVTGTGVSGGTYTANGNVINTSGFEGFDSSRTITARCR